MSGTGALKVGFDFLARNGYKTLYVSDPTWGNHILMAKTSGFVVKKYRYYDPSTKSVDFEGLYQDIEVQFFTINILVYKDLILFYYLKAAPENSVMVMHGCAHNPSGIDISQDQWSQLSKLFK